MKVNMSRDCGLQSPDYGGKDFKSSPENVQLVNVGGEEAINLMLREIHISIFLKKAQNMIHSRILNTEFMEVILFALVELLSAPITYLIFSL